MSRGLEGQAFMLVKQSLASFFSPLIRYDPAVLERVMKPGYKVITSLRDPLDRLVSSFYYNRLDIAYNASLDELVERNAM